MFTFLQRQTQRVGILTWRILKRLMILAVGILSAYLIAWRVFPAFNQRVSLALAILFTYGVSAYLVIPAGIRLIRLWSPSEQIPQNATTPDGFACDPINIAFVGTRHQIITAFKKAGWHEADKKTLSNVIKVIRSVILKQHYPSAPFSTLYLFGRGQDLGFQKQVGDSYFHRHHVRIWACSEAGKDDEHPHATFWRKKIKLARKQKQLWVGAAIKDTGIGIIRYHGQLTHSVDSNIDAERDFILSEMKSTNSLSDSYMVTAGQPTTTSNRVLGNEMISSGEMIVCVL